MTEILHFLIVFDHAERRMLVEPLVFSDAMEAVDAYFQAEQYYEDQRDRIEVVLLGSDSLETVAQTHPIFFREDQELAVFTLLEDMLAEAR
jgi:hypothetical protein